MCCHVDICLGSWFFLIRMSFNNIPKFFEKNNFVPKISLNNFPYSSARL